MKRSSPVVPRGQAALDIDEALDHYLDEGGTALGLRFVDALEAAIAHIGQSPGMARRREE